MKKRISLILLTITLMVSLILSGCQTGNGISQAQYDQLNAQLQQAQQQLAACDKEKSDLQSQKSDADAQLKDARAQVSALQSQVAEVQAQLGESSLVGATPAETAAKIVKYYHDTHVYSTYDFFVCSDMASEVWNMLKAQGISAVIVVGDVHNLVSDILQSNHAWVLATVGSGEVLALETTAGRSVSKSENAYYYIGWSFKSPAELKANNDLRKEYNVRVEFRNQLNNEANKALAENNYALYEKLVELRTAQETELNNIMSQINQLATQIY